MRVHEGHLAGESTHHVRRGKGPYHVYICRCDQRHGGRVVDAEGGVVDAEDGAVDAEGGVVDAEEGVVDAEERTYLRLVCRLRPQVAAASYPHDRPAR